MKIIFFGTSAFAVSSLKALAGSRHKIVAVVTQPDRPKGRNLVLKPPVIKEIASSLNIPILQPAKASDTESIKRLREFNADLFVVVSFGQLLSEELLAVPKQFTVNLHASLLPKYRGAAPINWAIINGEKTTGVTVFRLVKKMDAGDIISEKTVEIVETDNAMTLSEKLSEEGSKLLVDTVDSIELGRSVFKKQDDTLVTFAPRLKKEEGRIDWQLSAMEIHNRVRGFLPWPSAFTQFNKKMLKILESEVCDCPDARGCPGKIIEIRQGSGIIVMTGNGCVVLKSLQLEGSRPMEFMDFVNGHPMQPGDVLG